MGHTTSSPANDAAHTVLGILGNIASCLFFISSLPTIVGMVRCKSSGGLSGDLYLLKLSNCMLWCLYGLPYVHPNDLWVVLTNSLGCAFALLYILTYFLYATTKEKIGLLWKLSVIVATFAIMVVLLVLLSKSQMQRRLVVGTLSTIKKALQLRDSAFLHPSASIAGFVKGAIWSSYGVVSFDIFILIPNGVGVLIGIIQFILFLFFIRQSTPNVCDDGHDRQYGHQQAVTVKMSVEASVEAQMDYTKKQNEQESIDNTSRRATLSFSNVSRVPSILGIPRQGSISSSVIIPITLDDHQHC